MWNEWARRITIVAGVIALIWTIFVAELGYQSVASHIVDIWNSRVMHEKRSLVQDQLEQLFEGSLMKVQQERKKLAQRPRHRQNHRPISEKDRRSLDSLINQSVD